jgi:hypothetical protein
LERFAPGGDGDANRLRAAARRTLSSRADLVAFADGHKLLQPNGICFKGRWRITEYSHWTGLFQAGTDVPAIVRAPVALSATTAGARRAFALAFKLFPAYAPDVAVLTDNLFVMETLTGTRKNCVLDAKLDNQPGLGGIPGSFHDLDLGTRLREDLNAVDAALSPRGPDYGYRPVTGLVCAGTGPEGRAPHWIGLEIAADTPRIDAADFRDELRTRQDSDHRLRYVIRAADPHPRGKGHTDWRMLGALELTDSVTSARCDGRLHFAHPRIEWRGLRAAHAKDTQGYRPARAAPPEPAPERCSRNSVRGQY